MAMDTAKTLTSAGGGRLMTVYYDKLFLKVAEKQLVHKQLGQINRQIGKGEGGYGSQKVQWTRFVNLDAVTSSAAGEGAPTSACIMACILSSSDIYDSFLHRFNENEETPIL